MKRLELFEFEDFQWLPNSIRSGVTNLIQVFHRLMGTSEVLGLLIARCRQKYDFEQVVDMGSGSGGPMPEVIGELNKSTTGSPLKLLLTDIYPNPDLVDAINRQNLPNVRYRNSPLNATELGTAPGGLKTMIASFHHLKPADARKVLRSAEESKQPILLYELARNTIPTLLWWLLLPLSLAILFVMAWGMTPFVRPISLSQWVLTYLIPIIPLVYAWDGQASLMRTYTFQDIQSLLGDRDEDNYVWEVGEAKKRSGKKAGYYVFGYPKDETAPQ